MTLRKVQTFLLSGLIIFGLCGSAVLAETSNPISHQTRAEQIELLAAQLGLSPTDFEDLTTFSLRHARGIELSLWPDDPVARAAFEDLSPKLQLRFYKRRRFLIRRLVGLLAYPRILGVAATGKEKIKSAVQKIKSLRGKGEAPGDSQKGGSFAEKGHAILENLTLALQKKTWEDAGYIARASGVGLTIVGGPIWNTTVANKGLFWAHGPSVDFGVDFDHRKTYFHVYWDKQTLRNSVQAMDVGLMFDFFVHFRNFPENETHLIVDHQKLPGFGSYRIGPDYRAYGLQAGVNVLEGLGYGLTALGHPVIGGPLAIGVRVAGIATLYSTQFDRKLLLKIHLARNCAEELEN